MSRFTDGRRQPAHEIPELQFRAASRADADVIAALHAASWRRHYRGAYSDEFLDGDVLADRLSVWRQRMRSPGRSQTILATNGEEVIGFAHIELDRDPNWGALLDNLHVAASYQRRGIASRLLALTAPGAVERRTGLYLWVLEQNTAAQAFYTARGATCVERAVVNPPGGLASRLNGSPAKLRYAWPDPSVLLGTS